MKAIVSIAYFFKRLGVILRLVGLVFCFFILSNEAIPDLMFNMTMKSVKTYTEKEVLEMDIKDLPRFLRISNVLPYGDVYVKMLNKKKDGSTKLTSIIYPVYSISQIENLSESDDLSSIPCHIVVENSKVKEDEIDAYLESIDVVEGKFDHTFIKKEARDILVESGYNLSDNCILIQHGDTPASTTFCLIAIIIGLFLIIFILLSLLPKSVFAKFLPKNNTDDSSENLGTSVSQEN